MNTVELIKVINNIPVKGEVCAKDLLPEKKPLDMKAYLVLSPCYILIYMF